MDLLDQQPIEQQPKVFAQFAAGELDAFETLFRQFQKEVYSWIVRVVRDPAAAEELTIETFWRIYRAHARFDADRSFAAWARRIATNVAIDYLKSLQSHETQRAVSLSADDAHDSSAGNPVVNHAGFQNLAQNPAVQREVRERTQLAFQQLPAKLRAVAALALIEGCPHSEIADALNISTAAVKSRLFRATRLLRKKLENLHANNLYPTSLDASHE
jgi:RNA polymerase sigma-70 factor (ECF subfamily)